MGFFVVVVLIDIKYLALMKLPLIILINIGVRVHTTGCPWLKASCGISPGVGILSPSVVSMTTEAVLWSCGQPLTPSCLSSVLVSLWYWVLAWSYNKQTSNVWNKLLAHIFSYFVYILKMSAEFYQHFGILGDMKLNENITEYFLYLLMDI